MSDTAVNNNDKTEETRNITLVRGLMERGGFYWCYVAVKPERLLEFQKQVAENKYNIQNFVKDGYGEVIVSGHGRTPPKDITALLVEKLGVKFADLEGLSPEVAREKIMALTSQ